MLVSPAFAKIMSIRLFHLGDGFVKTIKVGQLGDVALNARNVGAEPRLHSLVEFLLGDGPL